MSKRPTRAANQFGKLKAEMEELNASLRELIANQQAAASAASAAAEQQVERARQAQDAANQKVAELEAKRADTTRKEIEGIKERVRLINIEAEGAKNVSDRQEALLELQDEKLNLLKKQTYFYL